VTAGFGITDLSFLAVATALASILLVWVLAGRHWRAPARVRARSSVAPTGAFTLLLAAEFSGRYAEVLRFAEQQLAGSGAASKLPMRGPGGTSAVLTRRLRRLERRMRWTGSPWWPSLDVWRSVEDRQARLRGQLELVLRDVNAHTEAGGSVA
jgi:hypothetical protein